MSVQIKIDDDTASLVRRYQGAAPIVRNLIARSLDTENEVTVSHIQQTKLTAAGPKFLNVQSGRLRRSVRPSLATVNGNAIKSSIGSNLGYARAHEFGAKAHKIIAKGRALKFKPKGGGGGKGGFIFRKSANIPALPARAPISTGIIERTPFYVARIQTAIKTEFGRL